MKVFPLKKSVKTNNTTDCFLSSYEKETEIPLLPHPGAFGCVRRFHQHEGVDLYAEDGDEVFSIEDGVVISIFPFTGEQVGSPWWNNTWAVMIEGESGVFNYGEIIPGSSYKIGDTVNAGQCIGHIRTVLTKDKGRPMSMLHLELYEKGVSSAISSWSLGMNKPDSLKDPTNILLNIIKEQ